MIKLDFKEITENISDQKIIELVTELGSDEYIDKDNYIIFKTICHNINSEDASLKLYYYKNTHMFVCYTECDETFNIFTLFKKRYELLNKEYNFYNDILLKILGNSVLDYMVSDFEDKYISQYLKYDNQKITVKHPILNKNILNTFIFSPKKMWIEDGISVDIMKYFNILFSISQNKIIIPHYDIDNNLIGIRGRAINEEDIALGKYMPVKIEDKIYSHPLAYNLYGLNLNKDNIKKFKMAIVVEGEKGVLQYGSMFGQDKNICVAVCGSNFHPYQFELLRNCGAERILLAFDKEGENWNQEQKYCDKLIKICNKYKNKCRMGYIYDTQNLLSLKQSPFDNGKEVAKELIKKGFWLN